MGDSTDRTILAALRRLPICNALQACDPQGLAMLAALGTTEHFDADEVVFSIGQPAEALRFLTSGRVALSFDGAPGVPRIVGTVSAGDLLGWSALRRADATWTLNARATKPTDTLVFPGTAVRELCEQQPEFGYCLMHYAFEVVAARLADARLQMLDIYGVQSPNAAATGGAAHRQ